MKYFKIFGSKCYIYNDRDDVGKFDTRSDEEIFLGYSINSRAYRVFNIRKSTVMESINVVIDRGVNVAHCSLLTYIINLCFMI